MAALLQGMDKRKSGMADEDAELAALRDKRLQELRQQQVQDEMLDDQHQRYDAQKHAILRQILTPEARERLGRLRVARPELAESIEAQLISLAQTGRLNTKISDDELRALLNRLVPQRREIKIERR